MTISAVLLAGGESRRMGQDKATMLFRNAPLWQNQLDLLRKLQPAKIFVSAQTAPPWRPIDIEFVSDDKPSRGPLSGIAAALSRMTSNHLLALAIDMPFMTANYLRGLCEKVQPGLGVVPVIENRFEPLAAVYPREACPEFVNSLRGNDFSLQSLANKLIAAGRLEPVEISAEERPLFRNLNEPADIVSDF
jgi:molybdenum cofactor guanylyltransferase